MLLPGIYSSVTLASDGTAFVGSGDNKVYALNTDGSLRWEFETGDWVDAVPALSQNQSTLYVGSWDNNLYALNTTDGSLAWSYETGNYILASPALGPDGTIYFGSNDSFFYALNPDGSLKWEYFLEAEETVGIHSSAAIGEDGTIYFGSQHGTLYALNPDGTLKWTYEVDAGANGETVSHLVLRWILMAIYILVRVQELFTRWILMDYSAGLTDFWKKLG